MMFEAFGFSGASRGAETYLSYLRALALARGPLFSEPSMFFVRIEHVLMRLFVGLLMNTAGYVEQSRHSWS